MLKINLGSGNKKYEGFLNLDKFEYFKPDILHDLEIFPYPFKDGNVEEIKMVHILEHIGKDSDTFNNVMRELYRICCNNAKIDIVVPHPRNDDFLADPSHVRPITTLGLQLYDKDLNFKWKKAGAANSQLALIHNVNFKIVKTTIILEKEYHELYESKKINHEQLSDFISKFNNVVKETHYQLKVLK